jgi:hypothetical protein
MSLEVKKSLKNYPYKDIACELKKGLKFGFLRRRLNALARATTLHAKINRPRNT